MQNDAPAPPPPSQPASAAQEPADSTEGPTVDGDIQNEAPSDLTQIALDVFAALPSLF
ncbi:MAG TPA: hypothetical protein VF591_24530 [Pyrinomonadaceae bacterium]|jgi:hypothetical protein